MAREISQTLDECLSVFGCTNCIYWLFPISPEDALRQARLLEELKDFRKRVAEAIGQSNVMVLDYMLNQLQIMKAEGENLKRLLTNKLKILCSDQELNSIWDKLKEQGRVLFTKTEFEQRFGFLAEDPFWCHVPDYTHFILGGGLGLSSPEYDMFHAMCLCHDRAIGTGRDLERFMELAEKVDDQGLIYVQDLNADERRLVDLERLHLNESGQGAVHAWQLDARRSGLSAAHHHEVRLAIVTACLFVEAFINSVAHAYRCKPAKPLSPEEDCDLGELPYVTKKGRENKGHVPLRDKLHRWVKLVSPHSATFDKGAYPYQEFVDSVVKYRDSIVHLSAPKAEKYRQIDLNAATDAVKVARDMVDKVCQYIAPNPAAVAYPMWLAKPQSDGLFHLSANIDLSAALIGEDGNSDRMAGTP